VALSAGDDHAIRGRLVVSVHNSNLSKPGGSDM
jgi:hypothetical protein